MKACGDIGSLVLKRASEGLGSLVLVRANEGGFMEGGTLAQGTACEEVSPWLLRL